MRRTRYQQGCLSKIKRKGGKRVWIFRWREIGPDGERRSCKQVIGTVAEYPSKRAAEQAIEALRIDINRANRAPQPKVIDFRTLADHYVAHELPLDQSEAVVEKAYSTIVTNKRYLRLWIIPRWGSLKLDPACWSPVEIEAWLRDLGKEHCLANGTRAKIRNVMSAVIQATNDCLLVVGNLADPLAREHLGVLSGLCDRLGIVGPARCQRHVAGLLEQRHPTVPA